MTGHQDFIAFTERNGVQDGVAAGGRIFGEHVIAAVAAEKTCQPICARAQGVRQVVGQELRRILLHPLLEPPLFSKHRARHRAKRSVVQERDIRIQQPLVSCNERFGE